MTARVIARTDTVVNVNRHTINANTKAAKAGEGGFAPPIRVAKGKHGKPQYGNEVAVLDKDGNEVAVFVYDPVNAVTGCGARLVLIAKHGALIKG